MNILDIVVLIGYLGGLLLLGAILSQKIKNSEDMFAAGGESPWWMAGISGYMTMFSSGTFVVWGGIAYSDGMVGVSILMMLGVSAYLVGWLLAGRWKASGFTSASEFIECRFGNGIVQFYSWIGMVYRMVGVGVALYSVSKLLCALIAVPDGSIFANAETGKLAVHWAILLCGIVVIIYTIAGGLWAVLMADVLQFVILTISVIVVVPMILSEVGGFNGFVSKVPEGFLSPINDEFTVLVLAGWVVIHFFKIGGEWAFVQRFMCVPDSRQAFKAAMIFGTLYMVSPVLWLLPPMIYRTINPAADQEQAYIEACRLVLPSGMIGFLMAAMFAATASMADSEINVFAGAFTRDIYGKIFHPKASEKHLLNVGRLFTLVLGAVVIAVALFVPAMGGAKDVIITITSVLVGPMVLPTIWGLFSKKVSALSAWITIFVSAIAGTFVKLITPGTDEPAIISSQLFLPLGEWISNNGRLSYILVGTLVPFICLAVMEILSKKEALGYAEAEKVRNEYARELGQLKPGEMGKKSSPLPLLVLGGYLSVVAAVMLYIGITQPQGKSIIISVSIILAVFGISLFCRGKKKTIEQQ